MSFGLDGWEISTATRPSTDPAAYPARNKSYFRDI